MRDIFLFELALTFIVGQSDSTYIQTSNTKPSPLKSKIDGYTFGVKSAFEYLCEFIESRTIILFG